MRNLLPRLSFPIAVALIALVVGLSVRVGAPPPVLGADAPPDVFAAGRAVTLLRELLGDESPHPVGTPANAAVRQRLIAQLAGLGLPTEVQQGVGCSTRFAGCAHVRNVIATIPGEQASAVLLMAHYDSVPAAPGAGDNGAGVAALLEIARILKTEGPFRNSFVFAFTDAEEAGLLGAETFFAEHPLAASIGAVLNVEGSGSSGVSRLLRTTPGSGSLVEFYRAAAGYPEANSIATEIFKRMPNDTDFSVAMRAGRKGADFAFAGERNHYHTPLDSIAHLDLRTLQHHGENLLPLARALAGADLAAIDGEWAYATVLRIWLAWPAALTIVLALAALALLFGAAWPHPVLGTWHDALDGLGGALLSLLAIVAVTAASLWMAGRLAGTTPSWPAVIWPWRCVLIGGAFVGLLAVAPPLARKAGLVPSLQGVWLFAAALALLFAIGMPLAAPLFLAPALGAALIVFGLRFVPPRRIISAHLLGATICSGLIALTLGGLSVGLEETQGYRLAPAFYVPFALLLMTTLPLFALPAAKRMAVVSLGVAGALLVGGLVGAAVVPLYSDMRPQHLSFKYFVDGDRGAAYWIADASDPLPESVTSVTPFERGPTVVPGFAMPDEQHAHALVVETPLPTLTVTSEAALPSGGRRIGLRVRSQRAAPELELLLSRKADLRALTIDGRRASTAIPPWADATMPDHQLIVIYAAPLEGSEIVLELGNLEPLDHFLFDSTLGLPEEGRPLARARGTLAVPARSGDLWVVATRVRF